MFMCIRIFKLSYFTKLWSLHVVLIKRLNNDDINNKGNNNDNDNNNLKCRVYLALYC